MPRGRRRRPTYEWPFEVEWDNARWLVIGVVEMHRSPADPDRYLERVRFEEVFKWGPRKKDWVRASTSYFMDMYGKEFSEHVKELAADAGVRAQEERDERGPR
jgi:hypothetical protein